VDLSGVFYHVVEFARGSLLDSNLSGFDAARGETREAIALWNELTRQMKDLNRDNGTANSER